MSLPDTKNISPSASKCASAWNHVPLAECLNGGFITGFLVGSTMKTMYRQFIQLAYEMMTRDGNHTPEAHYVERELSELWKFALAGREPETYVEMLDDSPSEDALDGIRHHLNEDTSFEKAARDRMYEVFYTDVFDMLLENGHTGSIPRFHSYESDIRRTAEWAANYAEDSDAEIKELLEQEVLDGTVTEANRSDLRWLARHASEDVDMSWMEGGAPLVIDNEYREELYELRDAIVKDCLDYIESEGLAEGAQ